MTTLTLDRLPRPLTGLGTRLRETLAQRAEERRLVAELAGYMSASAREDLLAAVDRAEAQGTDVSYTRWLMSRAGVA
ncbi:hypothetical protein [Aquipuribacter nitratireducens]|uniref:Uncharacterized protein n=1 Tax=Aquipuribacter nitratireducens TaxID=650104 RepID=A0ABW0GIY2_9MICO